MTTKKTGFRLSSSRLSKFIIFLDSGFDPQKRSWHEYKQFAALNRSHTGGTDHCPAANIDEIPIKIGDITGTGALVFAGSDQPVADGWIGEAPSQGGVSGGGLCYLRLPGDSEVYAVGGYLNPQFDKAFNDWRNKTFLRLGKEQIWSIHATGAAGFCLQKKGALWTDPKKLVAKEL